MAFYVANAMEIFERLAWYGVYTLLAIYIITPATQGGLGFSQAEKGLIMGVVPFFLYLFPVVSGAFTDRFGYRTMFLISFVIMAPSYYLLGQVKDLWSFFGVFMLVALGAGIFKPVVTGTISCTTDQSNRGLGFGVFYMMVNIGGALGPLLAPLIKKHFGWEGIFAFAALWISLNFIPALFFYKDPVKKSPNKSIKAVLQELQVVMDNLRLALLVFPLLILMVVYNTGLMGGVGGISPGWTVVIVAMAWVLVALIWDLWCRKYQYFPVKNWYQEKMKVGNKAFMVYLLIMAGFWTVYLQVFITLPNYIQDFVDTSDLVSGLRQLSPWLYDTFTHVDVSKAAAELNRLAGQFAESGGVLSAADGLSAMYALNMRVPQAEFTLALQSISNQAVSAELLIGQWAEQYRQMSPSVILSIDFIMIVLFQISISAMIKDKAVLPILIWGTAIVSMAMLLGGMAHTVVMGGILVAIAVAVFAVGEMIASPKSQEYVASFAPKNLAAMFMGYYFVAVALGNLMAGLLSGWLYQWLALDLGQPILMWGVIAMIGGLTCVALFVFNRTMVSDIERQQAERTVMA